MNATRHSPSMFIASFPVSKPFEDENSWPEPGLEPRSLS